jgi:drug/metabolite transporter (DMT)-like permease
MSKPIRMSMQTRMNWLIDAAVFLGGILAGLSGIYFLFLPSGGYRGGRNPMYGVTVLFERHTWSEAHTWGGVIMVAAVAIHFAIHWEWVKRMSRRTWTAFASKDQPLSKGAQINVAIDLLIAVSFVVCALSGVYFLLAPAGGAHGVLNADSEPVLLFGRTTWDLVHTWSGVVLAIAAVLHFAIHWRWVKNVSARFFLSLRPGLKVRDELAVGKAGFFKTSAQVLHSFFTSLG